MSRKYLFQYKITSSDGNTLRRNELFTKEEILHCIDELRKEFSPTGGETIHHADDRVSFKFKVQRNQREYLLEGASTYLINCNTVSDPGDEMDPVIIKSN